MKTTYGPCSSYQTRGELFPAHGGLCPHCFHTGPKRAQRAERAGG